TTKRERLRDVLLSRVGLLGQVHTKPVPVISGEHPRAVALASCIIEQPQAAWSETTRFAVAGGDLHLTGKRDQKPALGGRMPGAVPVSPDVHHSGGTRRDGDAGLESGSTRH